MLSELLNSDYDYPRLDKHLSAVFSDMPTDLRTELVQVGIHIVDGNILVAAPLLSTYHKVDIIKVASVAHNDLCDYIVTEVDRLNNTTSGLMADIRVLLDKSPELSRDIASSWKAAVSIFDDKLPAQYDVGSIMHLAFVLGRLGQLQATLSSPRLLGTLGAHQFVHNVLNAPH